MCGVQLRANSLRREGREIDDLARTAFADRRHTEPTQTTSGGDVLPNGWSYTTRLSRSLPGAWWFYPTVGVWAASTNRECTSSRTVAGRYRNVIQGWCLGEARPGIARWTSSSVGTRGIKLISRFRTSACTARGQLCDLKVAPARRLEGLQHSILDEIDRTTRQARQGHLVDDELPQIDGLPGRITDLCGNSRYSSYDSEPRQHAQRIVCRFELPSAETLPTNLVGVRGGCASPRPSSAARAASCSGTRRR